MRARRAVCLIFLLLGVLCISAAAEDTSNLYEKQLSASGAGDLTEKLPADVHELLEQLSLDDLQPDGLVNLDLTQLLDALFEMLKSQRSGPLQAVASLTAVVVLSAMFSGLEGLTDRPSLRETYHTVSVLSACGLLITPFSALLHTVQQAVDSVSVFMLSYVPVYGAVLVANGGAAGAISYQTTLLTAAELLVQLLRAVVIPVLLTSLALGCTGAVAEGFCLDSLGAALHKGILWALGLFSTLFSGVLSVQQMVAAANDTLRSRAMRFSIASFVPVVGGALSEAYSTVVGCAGLLRSTVGCFGIVSTVLIVLPPLLSCVCWNLCLLICASVAALFRLSSLEKLCKTVAGAVRVLIAVLAVFALLMIVSTSVIVFSGKGGVT